jgi:hypothetical protein
MLFLQWVPWIATLLQRSSACRSWSYHAAWQQHKKMISMNSCLFTVSKCSACPIHCNTLIFARLQQTNGVRISHHGCQMDGEKPLLLTDKAHGGTMRHPVGCLDILIWIVYQTVCLTKSFHEGMFSLKFSFQISSKRRHRELFLHCFDTKASAALSDARLFFGNLQGFLYY